MEDAVVHYEAITSSNLELNGKNRHQGRCTNNLF
jgi:hypothetical protein